MKKELKAIIPGQGLGVIKFGTTRDQVLKILGEPDEKETYSFMDDADYMTESWHYDDLELSMSFDEEENWRLAAFSVSSEFYELEGFHPIGIAKEALLTEFERLKIRDIVYEDCSSEESPAHELYTSEQLAMNFWLDENEVSEIQWGPMLIDEDTIDWPL